MALFSLPNNLVCY